MSSAAVISALLANESENFLVKAVDEKVKKLVLVDPHRLLVWF